MTRNSSKTLEHFSSQLWSAAGLPPFSVAISRDDEGVPPKPDPEALRLIAEHWGVPLTRDILMVRLLHDLYTQPRCRWHRRASLILTE